MNKSYIIGQLSDPNIVCIKHHFDEFIDLASAFEWDLQTNEFRVNNEIIQPHSIFMRHNVFETQTAEKYANYYVLYNYLLWNTDVHVFNRKNMMATISKLYDLQVAKKLNFNIPETVYTKQLDKENQIVKPVMGGSHVAVGNEAISPCIIQDRIEGKNIRVYAINGELFAFEIITSEIDYRTDNNVDCKLVTIPKELKVKIVELNKQLELTFTASDFMFDGSNYYYLETNDMPMFVVFDNKSKGELGKQMYKELQHV